VVAQVGRYAARAGRQQCAGPAGIAAQHGHAVAARQQCARQVLPHKASAACH
jgi:hypothetical protein